MNYNMNDPMDAAMMETQQKSFLYGQAQVTADFVVLVKGVGKLSYTPNQHEIKDRQTEITITVNPIEETGLTKLIIRNVLVNSKDWTAIVWKSLKDGCGLTHIRDLDGKFVKFETVDSGRKWTDKKTGEERTSTTMKFHAVYESEEACKAAYAASAKVEEGDSDESGVMDVDMSHGAGDAPAAEVVDENEKKTAAAFLPGLVKAAAGNVETLKAILSSNPMISKYFTFNSPEVVELLKKAA